METINQTIDPVCGMKVEAESGAGHSTYAGTTYYFCSMACKGAFDAEPFRLVVEWADRGERHAV